MTSSENLASIEPWAFRSAFADSWLSEAFFASDKETLTKALQKSLSNNNNHTTTNTTNSLYVADTLASDFIATFINNTPETSTFSNVSSSDLETLPKRHRAGVPIRLTSGNITKRKPRASKKTQTTFITADPANFRQMVQQVTGVSFGNAQLAMPPILKPEPQRPGSQLSGIGGGYLPTLDTSAFLLDHLGFNSGLGAGPVMGSGQFDFQSASVDEVGRGVGSGLDFDALSNFPTLESWEVM